MTWQDFSFWEIVLDIIALCLCGTAVIALVRQKRTEPQPAPAQDREIFSDILTRLTAEGMARPGEGVAPFHLGKIRDTRAYGSRNDRYHEVEHWADSGLSAEEITRKIDIPKGEVELVMKLKQQAGEFCMKNQKDCTAAG